MITRMLAATAVVGFIVPTIFAGADVDARHTASATATRSDESRLRGDLADLVRTSDADALIPISIVMSAQLDDDTRTAITRMADKRQRRAAMIDALKQVAAEGQADVLEHLRIAQESGNVGENLRALWVHSVIATEATLAEILRLAHRPDIAWINWDRPVARDIAVPVLPDDVHDDKALTQQQNRAIECGVDLMGAPEVWNDLGYDGSGVVVAVIDSGCCVTHPDLNDHLWINTDEIPDNGIDDDSNGFIDDIYGWNFEDDNNNPTDTYDHGTHVTGTVCSDGTDGEQVGMAPEALFMTLKIWGSFSGESTVWACMQYGLDNGADIETASLGWPHSVDPDRTTWRMVCENTIAAGVVVIYAAGNEGGGNPPDNVRTPGDVPDVITIGATDCSDNIAGFSSRGPVTWQDVSPYFDHPYPPGLIKPDVSAPGSGTLSCSVTCSGYSTKSGTSMATPHVAGAVALMLHANPSLDHHDVKQILQDTAVDLGAPGMDNDFGSGRVDAYAATLAALDGGLLGDLNNSRTVDTADLLILLGAWGDCDDPCPPSCVGDLDDDCVVGTTDILILLANWS